MTETLGFGSCPKPCSMLLGQDHLSAETLVLGGEGAEVDAAGTTAPSGVPSVPDEVVVTRLLVAVPILGTLYLIGPAPPAFNVEVQQSVRQLLTAF
jgi:hypothetical protein